MKYFLYSLFLAISFSCANQVEKTGALLEHGDDDRPANNEVTEESEAAGKLYLRTIMVSGSIGSGLTITWIYFGDDGIVVYDPANGVNPINYAAERANNIDNVGKYKIQGDHLIINWDNGKTSNVGIEYQNGDINIIDGGITVRQAGVPAGFMLNGRYAGGAINKSMSAVHTYFFKDDGSFVLKRQGSVNTTKDGPGSAEDEKPGNYTITGNTLTLQYQDGTKLKAVIGVKNMKGGYNYLIINQTSFLMEK